MGILSFFCGISAAQPQYWGEGTYDLENVVFGMKVDKYYSKAKPYDQMEILKSRGILFDDEQAAFECLKIISYFRLANYWKPMESDKVK